MIRPMQYVRALRALAVVAVMIGLAGLADAREAALLAPSRGQLPTDIGSDDRTKVSLTERAELRGKVLRVERLAGDSFGDRAARVTDWKQFIVLKCDAVNPATKKVQLILSVTHRRTTGYQTRVDVPFTLKPGKNSIVLGIDEMTNVNGSLPDLAHVSRWYIACAADQRAPQLYFGDFVLEGPDDPAGRIAGAGGMPVDLITRPTAGSAGDRPQVNVPIKTDPARVARIRAAKMPAITGPVMFDTPKADAIVSALEVFPPDNAFNQLVEHWPVHPNSDAIIRSIGPDKPLRYNPDMAYILVPPNQPKVPVTITLYPGESEPGPYPVPDMVPIEGWPDGFAQFHRDLRMTLDDLQRDKHGLGGDRHAIVVDPVSRILYEFYQMKKTDRGWQASCAAIFDLTTNKPRPLGWTSADAAGLPIFPAVVRYDELKRGKVEHAMRVTVRRTRRAYVAPATHHASRHENEDYPRMGERLRLRHDFDISSFSPPVQAILGGLKRYGMLVADNGLDWAISVAPDARIPNMHAELRRVPGSAFEVVMAPQGSASE